MAFFGRVSRALICYSERLTLGPRRCSASCFFLCDVEVYTQHILVVYGSKENKRIVCLWWGWEKNYVTIVMTFLSISRLLYIVTMCIIDYFILRISKWLIATPYILHTRQFPSTLLEERFLSAKTRGIKRVSTPFFARDPLTMLLSSRRRRSAAVLLLSRIYIRLTCRAAV